MEARGPYRLRPGYVVVRRDNGHLQVGIDPPRRVILRDNAEVRRLLYDLVGSAAAPSTGTARAALARLHAADLVIDSADPPPPAPAVQVRGPTEISEFFSTLLGPATATDPQLVVLLAAGALARERADDVMRAGTAHLIVQGGADRWQIGPLVVPGVTACVRCVDAALGEDDPRRALVVEQAARAGAPPADPLLQSLALAWAARDVLAYLAGQEVASLSGTVTVTRTRNAEVRRWLRHPHCGCAWDLVALAE
ncbi:MAG: hypothetical protein QM638_11110 [Nocardioides sp.]|uniref:hypothetical protein n=1 Tax=Nocardioides sp. TaxID=35761 RepID=UPI0039E38220